MKMNIVTLFTLLIVASTSLAKFSGYEENIESLVSSIQYISDNFMIAFEPVIHYTTNIENYESNDMLFNDEFKNKLNEFIVNINQIKAPFYRHLKVSLKNLHYIRSRELSFDLYLSDGYSDIIKFIANFELDAMEPELRDLFKDFVAQKNMLFYNVKELYKYSKYLTINAINLYDQIETFHKYSKAEDDTNQEYSLDDIKNYYFMLGFIRNLKKYYDNHKHIENTLMTLFEQWEGTLSNFDESLETINVYYHRRYTEGVNDESEDREPILVCNNMYLKNFWINGETKAEAIDKFNEIRDCPNILNSCCSRTEIRRLYIYYYHIIMPVIKLKYSMLFGIFEQILNNYSKYQRHAYQVMKKNESRKNDPNANICYEKARSLIFNPISKEFVTKFKQFADKAYEFAKSSRAGVYCTLCDYDFHKTMMEDNSIKLSKDFCSSMIDNTLDYTTSYHLQLEDYFNDLIQVFQCDPDSGIYRKETDLVFKPNTKIREILIKCDENKRENCYDYCSDFYFTRFNSIFDVSFDQLADFYRFISNRMKFFGYKMEGFVDDKNFSKFSADMGVEKSVATQQHVDDLIRKFIEDPEDNTGHNPFIEGPSVLDLNRFMEDDDE